MIVDCSQRLDGAAAKAAGVTVAVRYLSSIPGPKILTGAELADLHNHGIAVALVHENGTGDCSRGAQGGFYDASVAAWEIGVIWADAGLPWPYGAGVYFAADENPPDANTGAYMKAAAATVAAHGLRCGFYGNRQASAFLLVNGVTSLGWGVRTWPLDNSHAHDGLLHLIQEPNIGHPIIGGVECDWNTQLAADLGQWPRP